LTSRVGLIAVFTCCGCWGLPLLIAGEAYH
jgi:hypothetical protein